MKKLNRKGYLTIEIVLASVMTFVIAFFLIDLTMKLVDNTDNAYADIVLTTDKALIVKNIREHLSRDMSINGNIEDVNCVKNTCTITMNNGIDVTLSLTDNIVKYEGSESYSKKIHESLSNISISSNESAGYYNFKISGDNIFVNENYDMNINVYNKSVPILAAGNTWYNGKTDKSKITKITFVDDYVVTGNEMESWPASANLAQEGVNNEIMCYINGTELVIAGNGTGKIYANKNSNLLFGSDGTNYNDMFSSLTAVEGIEILDTSMVTTMVGAFANCNSLLNLDLSSFDTSNITNMTSMFYLCSSLESLNLSGFDTSNVTDMKYMFRECSSLSSLDVSMFDTSNVTNMSLMFYKCTGLQELNVSNFDTSNVTNMSWMFSRLNINTIDLTNFNTSKVKNMGAMFHYCVNLKELDLTSFDMSNVEILSELSINYDTGMEEMAGMFDECHNLTTIYVSSNINLSNVTESTEMFGHCDSLVGGSGTTYNYDYIDKSYARIDEGPSNPGYFTYRESTT